MKKEGLVLIIVLIIAFIILFLSAFSYPKFSGFAINENAISSEEQEGFFPSLINRFLKKPSFSPLETGYVLEHPQYDFENIDSEIILNGTNLEDDWFKEGRDYGRTSWSKTKIEPPVYLVWKKNDLAAELLVHNNSVFALSRIFGLAYSPLMRTELSTGKNIWGIHDEYMRTSQLSAYSDDFLYFWRFDDSSKRVDTETGKTGTWFSCGSSEGNYNYVYKDQIFVYGWRNPCSTKINISNKAILWALGYRPYARNPNYGWGNPSIFMKNLLILGEYYAHSAFNISTGDEAWLFNVFPNVSYDYFSGKWGIGYKDRIYLYDPFYLYSLEASTGKTLWKKVFPAEYLSKLKSRYVPLSFLSFYEDGFFVSDGGFLYKIGKNGELLFSVNFGKQGIQPYPITVGDFLVSDDTPLVSNKTKERTSIFLHDAKTYDKIGEIKSHSQATYDSNQFSVFASNNYLILGSRDFYGAYSSFFPVADAGKEINVYAGEEFYLDASNSYDRLGNIKNFEWNINGEIKQGEKVEYSFDTAGEYLAVLKIKDERGYSDSDVVKIKVYPDNPPVISRVYADKVTDTSAEINFETDKLATAEILYGMSSLDNYKNSDSKEVNHKIEITGLEPNTKYRFKVIAKDLRGKTTETEEFYFYTSSGKQELILQNGVYPNAGSKFVEDTGLRSDKPEDNHASSGGVYIGGGSYVLMKFNVSLISPGSYVTNSSLRLYYFKEQRKKLLIHKMNVDVDFTKATYYYIDKNKKEKWYENKVLKPYFGRDVESFVYVCDSSVSPANPSYFDCSIASIISDWVDGKDNFGLFLRILEQDSGYYSSESSNLSTRPKLSIEYYPSHIENSVSLISDINVEIQGEKAVITWKTDKPSKTEISYGIMNLSENYKDEKLKFTHKAEIEFLKRGTTYKYKIKAKNSGNFKSETGVLEFYSPQEEGVISAPENLIAHFSEELSKTFGDSIVLKWDLSYNKNVDGYKIYKSENGIDFEEIAEVGIRDSYQDFETQENKAYYYKIKAVDENNLESEFSDIVSADTINLAKPSKAEIRLYNGFAYNQRSCTFIYPTTVCKYENVSKIIMELTIPYDKDISNAPYKYDIRISKSPITEDNFLKADKCVQMDYLTPITYRWEELSSGYNENEPGNKKIIGIANASYYAASSLDKDTTYYLAVKSVNEEEVYSDISAASIKISGNASLKDIKTKPDYFFLYPKENMTFSLMYKTNSGLWEGQTCVWYKFYGDICTCKICDAFGIPELKSEGGEIITITTPYTRRYSAGNNVGIFYINLTHPLAANFVPVVIKERNYKGNKPNISLDKNFFDLKAGENFQQIVGVSDKDGDKVRIITTKLPSGMVFDDATNKLSWTPNKEDVGEYRVSLIAFDGHVASSVDLVFRVVSDECFIDNDNDGYYNVACGGSDCDDSNPNVFSGAYEVCDKVDNDCNTLPDDGCEIVIVDNDDENVAFIDGYWKTIEKNAGDIFSPFRGSYAETRSGKQAIFKPKIKQDGDYDVYARWYSGRFGSYSSNNIKTEINNGNKNNIVYVSQQDPGDNEAWQYLGTYDFTKEKPAKITFNGYFITADAIKLVKTEPIQVECDFDLDGYESITCGGQDCNDNNAKINPSATEVCDGVDNNCDGSVDEGFGNETCKYVCQANGFIWTNNSENLNCCGNDLKEDSPYEMNETSCLDENDNDCDGFIDLFDNNCFGKCFVNSDCGNLTSELICIENNLTNKIFTPLCINNSCSDITNVSLVEECKYGCSNGSCLGLTCIDNDNDGYNVTGESCGVIDCDDNNVEINPGKVESCNNLDDNCNNQTDEGFDKDNDDWTTCNGDCNDNNASINPSAMEVCNNIDDNCDKKIDEGLVKICGSGVCAGMQSCVNGTWSSCSTENIDAGICSVCLDGIKTYDNSQDSDCDSYDLPKIETCNNNPDNNSLTFDYFAGFDSECSGIDTCTSSSVILTHTCSIEKCSAECEQGTRNTSIYYCLGQKIYEKIESCQNCLWKDDSTSDDLFLEECSGTGENSICKENSNSCNQCSDSIDNDEDGCIDNAGSGCGGKDDNCNGLDDNCNGKIDEDAVCECVENQKRSCPLQEGMCKNSEETCIEGKWSGCDYGTDYEETELTCNDEKDNDCDGKIDCTDGNCAGKLNKDNKICCQDDSICGNDDCKIETCENNVCKIENREAGSTEECGTCSACNIVGGNCTAVISDDGKNCREECTICVGGSCVLRAVHDYSECNQTCYACDGTSLTCQPDTHDSGLNCAKDGYSCDEGSCKEIPCCSDADGIISGICDGVVSNAELLSYISKWFEGEVSNLRLLDAILKWKNGC